MRIATNLAFAGLPLLLLVGCQGSGPSIEDAMASHRRYAEVLPPSEAFIMDANVGEAPDRESARATATTVVKKVLKDPGSAQIVFGEVRRGWYLADAFSPTKFAWMLPMSVNARNSHGGYTGAKSYRAYFIGDTLVALMTPHTSRYGTGTRHVITEFNGGGRTAEQAGPHY